MLDVAFWVVFLMLQTKETWGRYLNCLFSLFKAQLKADTFGGKIATKMAALEEFLKSHNDGKGFFVGDSVSIYSSYV